eukprot:TRINITY_DN31324_c0_g1_i1.p1 TRINITY_DN31324_c0_g1~~TRINITY_DN31324_c0_g1_i1.p1  ORF type:complete len:722 (-),score=105.09 TRINITY_DN31324_c0_g1_i1:51-2216(-)
MATLYDVLGVSRNVQLLELRAAFKLQALCKHPDKGGSKEMFQQVMLAYETLSDSRLRAKYDSSLDNVEKQQTRGAKRKHSSRNAARCHARGMQEQPPHDTRSKCMHKKHSAVPVVSCAPAVPQPPLPTVKPKASTSEGIAGVQFAAQEQGRRPSSGADHCQGNKSMTGCGVSHKASGQQGRPAESANGAGADKTDKESRILHELHQQLAQVLPGQRRQLLGLMRQEERRALELWIVRLRSQGSGHSEDAVQRIADLSSSSSSDSEDQSQHALRDNCITDDELHRSTDMCSPLALCDEQEMMKDNTTSADHDGKLHASCGAAVNDSTNRRGHNTRCIQTRVYGRCTYYRANVNVRRFNMQSRNYKNLNDALDMLVAFLAIKAQLAPINSALFADAVKATVPAVFAEHSLSDNGVRYFVDVASSWYFGERRIMALPSFPNLESSLYLWTSTQPFIKHRGGDSALAAGHFLLIQDQEWTSLKAALLDAIAFDAETRRRWDVRLEEHKAAAEPHRQRATERWNLHAMGLEERRQCRANAFELRSQRRDLLEERRMEKASRRKMAAEDERAIEQWNRHAMWREEMIQRRQAAKERYEIRRRERILRKQVRQERRLERFNTRAMAIEDRATKSMCCIFARLEQQFERVIARWRKLSVRMAQKAAIMARRAETKAVRIAAAVAAEKRKQEKLALARQAIEKRKARTEREARWRHMNRKDISMAEIMGR